MTIEAIIGILKNIEPFTNIAVVIIALVAIIQTTISIRQTKRDSLIHLILTMYTECRKVIDGTRIEGWARNPEPIGLDCFKAAYDTLFRANLTKCTDKSKKLTEQVEEDVVPTLNEVEKSFDNIVNDNCPNISTYLSSVVSILAMIDSNRSLCKKNKIQCASYIKAQTTKYEKLWLYYYGLLNKKDAALLCKYHIVDSIPQKDKFAINCK